MQYYKFDVRNYQAPINNTIGGMSFIYNGHDINKDATKITSWNFRKKGHYANDRPDNNPDTDTATDKSRKYGSANVINGFDMQQ